MLVKAIVPEVDRYFLLIFCSFYFILFYLFLGIFSPLSPKALGGFFHPVDWLICLCSSSIAMHAPTAWHIALQLAEPINLAFTLNVKKKKPPLLPSLCLQ